MSMATVGAIVGMASSAYSASQSAKLAGQAAEDPFGKGNRQYYQRQLARLYRYPGAVFDDPAFKASLDLGLQGVKRTMASSGFLDSGNLDIELFRFGQGAGLDWFNKQATTLGNLAGAQMGPSYGAAVGAQGLANQGWSDAANQLGSAWSIYNRNHPAPAPTGGDGDWSYNDPGAGG